MNDAGTMGERSVADKPRNAGLDAAVERYGRFWAELAPGTTGRLRDLAQPGLRFVDPFNDVTGVERVVALLDHMFAGASDVRFTVLRHAWSGDTAFYRWHFTCRLRRPATSLEIAGVSEVRFTADGLVAEHVDHWDAAAQVYARLPGLGAVLRFVRARLSAGV